MTNILRPSVVVASLLVVGCTPPTPEQTFVTALANALGGRDKVDAAHVLDIQVKA